MILIFGVAYREVECKSLYRHYREASTIQKCSQQGRRFLIFSDESNNPKDERRPAVGFGGQGRGGFGRGQGGVVGAFGGMVAEQFGSKLVTYGDRERKKSHELERDS